MPTYVYQCRACDERFERVHKMTDPAVTECPSCGGSVHKVMHPPAIAFKGPGFYVNDYKQSSPTSRPSGESALEAAQSTVSEAKTEAKPEAPKAEAPKAEAKKVPAAV